MIDYIVAMISTSTFLPILQLGANPMRVTVIETSKLTEWPVEDGTTRTDHRVINPIEIDMPIIISSQLNQIIFEQLRQMYLNGDEIIVQTKMRTYDSMMITEMSHDETPEMFSGAAVSVRLKQVITVKAEEGELPQEKVADKNQSSTVNKGGQQTKPVSTSTSPAGTGSASDGATARKASTLYDLVY